MWHYNLILFYFCHYSMTPKFTWLWLFVNCPVLVLVLEYLVPRWVKSLEKVMELL